jgi:hypothetical protein
MSPHLDIDPGRPSPDEYGEFYAGYIERVPHSRVLAVLDEQRARVLEIFGRLDDDSAGFRYAPGKWSLKEMLGHLIDTERVFVYRALSFARGETQPLPGFEQDDYTEAGSFDARALDGLVEEYESVRAATLTFFANLEPGAWTRAGIASGATMSVRALAFATAGHEACHLATIEERYREAL